MTGKTFGSKNITKKNFGGSGTTGLAVRGSGSRTVTVKGKTSTHSKTNTKEHSSEVENSPLKVAFQGQGYTLGGNSSSVSKLVLPSSSSTLQLPSTSSDSNKSKAHHPKRDNSMCPNKDKKDNIFSSSVPRPEGNSSQIKQKSLDCYVGTSPLQSVKTVRCPVCDASLPERDINKHLDECVKNHSDDEAVREETKDEAQETSFCEILPSVSQEAVCSEGLGGQDIDSSQVSEANGPQCNGNKAAELYPCPVCGEGCLPATINDHLDSHF